MSDTRPTTNPFLPVRNFPLSPRTNHRIDIRPRPRWSNGGPIGDGYCCGERIHWRGPAVQLVAQMTDPPPTTDRWHLTYEWQCNVTRDHHGIHTNTTDTDPTLDSVGGDDQPR